MLVQCHMTVMRRTLHSPLFLSTTTASDSTKFARSYKTATTIEEALLKGTGYFAILRRTLLNQA